MCVREEGEEAVEGRLVDVTGAPMANVGAGEYIEYGD